MNELRYLLIDKFWYFIRIYMNYPNEWIGTNEVITKKLGKASDIDKVFDKIDEFLCELGLSDRIDRKQDITLQELLVNQIDNIINKTFENGKQQI